MIIVFFYLLTWSCKRERTLSSSISLFPQCWKNTKLIIGSHYLWEWTSKCWLISCLSHSRLNRCCLKYNFITVFIYFLGNTNLVFLVRLKFLCHKSLLMWLLLRPHIYSKKKKKINRNTRPPAHSFGIFSYFPHFQWLKTHLNISNYLLTWKRKEKAEDKLHWKLSGIWALFRPWTLLFR